LSSPYNFVSYYNSHNLEGTGHITSISKEYAIEETKEKEMIKLRLRRLRRRQGVVVVQY
jgi:hypothetical protein